MHVRFNSNQLHGWVSQDDLSSSDESCLQTHHLLRGSGEEPLSFFVWGENADNNNQYSYLGITRKVLFYIFHRFDKPAREGRLIFSSS